MTDYEPYEAHGDSVVGGSCVNRLLALVLLSVVTASGCGQSDEEQALGLARQACATYDDESTETVDKINIAETADRHEDAADEAARASRLDPTWDDLAGGFDQMAGFFTFVAGLPTDQGRPSQRQYTPEQQADLAERANEVRGAITAVGAECRKTS